MAKDIKLDCYHFMIKKSAQNARYYFSDFYNSFNSSGNTLSLDLQYNLFYASLLNYFGEEFRINGSESKGITIRQNDNISISPSTNTISGFLRGGLTGIGKTIQERTDAQSGSPIGREKIHSLPHYFLLWTPPEMEYGIVILQSYSSENVSGLFMHHLEQYFRSRRIVWKQRRKILPNSMMENFRNHSKIKSITLTKSAISRDVRNGFNPILADRAKLKIDLIIKGLGETSWDQVRDWLNRPNDTFLGVDLTNLDMDSGFDRIVEYEYQGRNSKGKLSKNFQIIPSIIITDEIEIEESSKHPSFASIDSYVKTFLEDLKTEIGYNVTP